MCGGMFQVMHVCVISHTYCVWLLEKVTHRGADLDTAYQMTQVRGLHIEAGSHTYGAGHTHSSGHRLPDDPGEEGGCEDHVKDVSPK